MHAASNVLSHCSTVTDADSDAEYMTDSVEDSDSEYDTDPDADPNAEYTTDPDPDPETDAGDRFYVKTYVPSTEEMDKMMATLQAAQEAAPRLCGTAVRDRDMVFTEELVSSMDTATLQACALLSAQSFRYKPGFRHRDYDDYYEAWCDEHDYAQDVETMLTSMRQPGRKYKDKADFEGCVLYLVQCASQRKLIFTGRSAWSNTICCACLMNYHDNRSTHDATPSYNAYLRNVCAFPASRGHGSRLMQYVKTFCNNQPNMQQVNLCVDKDKYMYATLKFYNSVGFHRVPERRGYGNVLMSYECTPHTSNTAPPPHTCVDTVVHMLNPVHMQQHYDLHCQHTGTITSQHTRNILAYMDQEHRRSHMF